MLTNDWAVEKDAVVVKIPERWSKNFIRPVNTLTVGAMYNYTLQEKDQTTR